MMCRRKHTDFPIKIYFLIAKLILNFNSPDPTSHLPTIRLIDFGCAIDMNFFDEKTQFKKVGPN